MDNIGQRVKEERQFKGWSQRDLARETGVNTDTISGIETGQHEPRPSTLRKLAEGLGVEVRDLFMEPVLPKAPAREAGQPESTTPIHVRREVLEEHGISVTDAELRVLNENLDGYRTGEVRVIVTLEGEVDWDRIHRLTTYVIAAGLLAPEEVEAVGRGAREQLVAAGA